MCRLLTSGASLVVEHGIQAPRLQYLWHVGSVAAAPRLQITGLTVVVQKLSCSAASGLFTDQGPKLCPLQWQMGSPPLSHQGSPGEEYLQEECTSMYN